MINALSETLLTLREAAALPPFRRFGRPVHVATLWRWRSRGARAVDGSRVRLETLRLPDGVRTSVQAIERFIVLLNNPGADAERSPSQREKASASDNADLAASKW